MHAKAGKRKLKKENNKEIVRPQGTDVALQPGHQVRKKYERKQLPYERGMLILSFTSSRVHLPVGETFSTGVVLETGIKM